MFLAKTLAALGAVALVAGAPLAASAQGVYRPLTVARPHQAPLYMPPPAYNPYQGPAVLVTAPVHAAGTIATAPFRAINAVFPPRGDTPLVLVGAPTYAVGRLVALPFQIMEAPFGGPNPFAY